MCTLSDIINYINEGVRPIIEGDRLLQAGFLILCGYVNAVNDVNRKILGLCLRSSSIHENPHQVEVLLNESYKNWICTCSCKAGEGGKCKHIVAVLLYINRVNDLEQLSCTDIEQVWGKRKIKSKEMAEAVPLDKFCHCKTNKNLDFDVSEEFKVKFFEECLEVTQNSEAAVHLRGRKTDLRFIRFIQQTVLLMALSSPCNFYNIFSLVLLCLFCCCVRLVCFREEDVPGLRQVVVENARHSTLRELLYQADICPLENCCVKTYNSIYPCNADTIIQETRKNRECWKDERQYRITASRCYGLYTYSKNNWTQKDWEAKSLSYFFPKPFSNVYTAHGIANEENARNTYKQYYNVDVLEIGLYVSQGNPWVACSPDGIVVDNDGYPTKLLEIKCPFIGSTSTIMKCLPHLPYLKKTAEHFILNQKHPYYGQVQLEMALLNFTRCDFVIYSSFDKSLYVIPIHRNDEFCKDLILVLKKSFFVHMLPTLCKHLNK